MTPQEFEQKLLSSAREVRTYTATRLPVTMGNTALRFIDGNFRAQGFQGTSFKKWKPNKRGGTVLVKSGNLRASNYYTTQPGQVTLKNDTPYAKANNEGLKEEVTVKAHTRNRYAKTKVGTGRFTKKGKERMRTMTVKSGESKVKSHRRKMNIPKRQFMPTSPNDSPVLNNAVVRQVSNDLKQIIR